MIVIIATILSIQSILNPESVLLLRFTVPKVVAYSTDQPSYKGLKASSSLQRAKAVLERAKAVEQNRRKIQKIEQELLIPQRPLAPPYPDGLNNGQLVTIPPSDTYLLDPNLSGNTLLLPPRDIQVWLPQDYDLYPTMRFPVLYCHDGQNAIQDSMSWTGHSWRLAGALTRLSERRLLTRTTPAHSPPILVLLPSAEGELLRLPNLRRRHLEYGDVNQVFAQAHADFVARTVKPLVDSRFRTLSDRKHTATIGTSLGGQAAMNLLIRHDSVFGHAACLSPAFQAGILANVATLSTTDGNAGAVAGADRIDSGDDNGPFFLSKDDEVRPRIYIDNGGDEEEVKVPFFDVFDHLSKEHWWNPGYWWLDSQLQMGVDAMRLALDARGVKYQYQKFAGGRHNERGWAQRIDKPLLALYGD